MSQFQGRGQLLEEDTVLPFYEYRKYIRFVYKTLIFQAALSYILYAFGVTFSFAKFHDHLVASYRLLFALAVMGTEFGCTPIKNIVFSFIPSIGIVIAIFILICTLGEDLVKFTLFFVVGIPSLFEDYSFQLQLGSILFTIIGFIGALISFRYENILSSYINYYDVEPITTE